MAGVIAFTVPGEPQGKGRARVGKVGGHARMFTPAKTVAYEGLIAHAAHAAMAGRSLIDGPCVVEVVATFSIPASWSEKKQLDALLGVVRPVKKPDGDNILKAACDGMNGIVWRDDSQAVEARVRKFYGRTPCLKVMVWPDQIEP